MRWSALSRSSSIKLDQVGKRLQRHYGLRCEVDGSLHAALVAACLLPDTGARNIDSLLNQQILPVLSQQLLQRQALGQPTQAVTLGYCEDTGISLSFVDEHDPALQVAEGA
jgi:type VI secretion system protein VasG